MAEKQNRLAAIRAKFQSNSAGFVPTPENQFTRMKKSKEANAKAVRIAKARAARYNMTLRALALQNNKKVYKQNRSKITDKKKISKEHAKYKATTRGLQVSRAVTAKDHNNIARALDPNVSPSVAKNVIKAVAKKQKRLSVEKVPVPVEDDEDVKTDDEDEGPSTAPAPKVVEEKKKSSIKIVKKKTSVKEEVEEPETEKEEEKDEEAPRKIEMTGMHEALAGGDDDALNKAILTNFLQTNAPQLADKADVLLDQFNSDLGKLFQNLLKKIPDVQDMEVSGQQKADKEIADAVEQGDVKVEKKEEVEKEQDEEEDSSLVMDEGEIDKYEPPEEKPKPVLQIEDLNLDNMSDSESDSMIQVQDEQFKEGYENTIKEAENGETLKALARRRTTMKLNNDLSKEVEKYKAEERLSFKSLKTIEGEGSDDDSLIQTPYIVNLEEKKEEAVSDAGEDVAPVRWAVQFENKNIALKKKLMKQGLSKQQVAELVDNLDQNTSEML